MKSINIEQSILIKHLQHHSVLKTTLLNSLRFAQGIANKSELESISKTDWTNAKDMTSRPYVHQIQTILTNHILSMFNHQYQSIVIDQLWYQQYLQSDFHQFHIHNAQYSAIYYLELKDNTYTQILVNNKIKDIEVTEGDVVVMPSTVVHRCPAVESEYRRTIISFNFDLEYFSEEYMRELYAK